MVTDPIVKFEATQNRFLRLIGNVCGKGAGFLLKVYLRWGTSYGWDDDLDDLDGLESQESNRDEVYRDNWCDTCLGVGYITSRIDGIHEATTSCLDCKGKGKLPK